jgi:hypothetical protein
MDRLIGILVVSIAIATALPTIATAARMLTPALIVLLIGLLIFRLLP